ncbi:MAG: aminotransferase class V-fold PLP-dependent enzyme [Microbacteriaceae bacterium]
MITINDYADQFTDEPGYLDFARVGPIGLTVKDEESALSELLGRARFGSYSILEEQDQRVREAVAAIIGFDADQIAFQPNTSQGLMHTMFGITGGVALAPSEFPSITFAAVRAAEALGVLAPQWLDTDEGRVTPFALRDQLDSSTTAVAVSLVDFRSGYLADIEGIRQVIGDRLLIVDAIQGFGVVEAPWQVADVIVSGGQKWARAGWGTGFIAMSERAIEQLTPVFSGFSATDAEIMPLDEVLPPTRGVGAFSISHADRVAEGRLAAALEQIAQVGVGAIRNRIIETTTRIIDIADEFGIAVVSSRAENERAGIVVIEPPAEHLAILGASLYNHGVTTTTRAGRLRLSAHASTDDETLAMLRASFLGYASAINV